MKAVNKEFWNYIAMSMLGMLGSSGTILADTFFVSNRLGASGLAALNVAIAVFGLINGIGMLAGIGGAAHYAAAMAAGKKERAERFFVISSAAALFFGILFFLSGVFFAERIAVMLGADAEVLSMCTDYLRIVLCFAPFFIINHLLMAFIRNDGKPQLSMYMMMTGSLVNTVLDYTFLYPMNTGIAGAAFATGLAPVISILLAVPYLRERVRRSEVRVFVPHPGDFAETAAPGMAAAAIEISSGIVLVVFNGLALREAGNTGIAAYGIVANLALVVTAVFNGIAQGIQPLLSRAFGLGDTDGAGRLYRKGIMTAAAAGILVFLAGQIFPSEIAALFNASGDHGLQSLAAGGIAVYFCGFPFAAFNCVTASCLSAGGKSARALLFSLIRGFIGICAAAWILTPVFGMGGIWLSFPAAEAGVMILSLCRKAADERISDRKRHFISRLQRMYLED